jgi:hypothetical protein
VERRHADPIWQSMINDTAYPPGAQARRGPDGAASAVRVKVLNGSASTARRLAEQLTAQGRRAGGHGAE